MYLLFFLRRNHHIIFSISIFQIGINSIRDKSLKSFKDGLFSRIKYIQKEPFLQNNEDNQLGLSHIYLFFY